PSVLLKFALIFVIARVLLRFNTSYLEADLRRLLQSLLKLGQVVLFSILPPAFTSFYWPAHVFCLSRGASWPALGSFLILTFLSGVLDCYYASVHFRITKKTRALSAGERP